MQDGGDEDDDECEEDSEAFSQRVDAQDRDRQPYKGQFAFQDRESGVFYQAFEQDFQAYLWQTYRARVTHIDIVNSRSGIFRSHCYCCLSHKVDCRF